MRFVLASGSPRRHELIASLGISFDIIKPDINERLRPAELGFDYVRRLSITKAESVASRLIDSSVILAADTAVVLAADTIGMSASGALMGKPVDAKDARSMLQRLRDRDHIVCTAFTLKHDSTTITHQVYTTVTMRPYTDDEIETYIASGDPFDKAGSYAIQNKAFHPVARIDGCYNNVVGLPLCAVKRALVQIGWPRITATNDCDCRKYSHV